MAICGCCEADVTTAVDQTPALASKLRSDFERWRDHGRTICGGGKELRMSMSMAGVVLPRVQLELGDQVARRSAVALHRGAEHLRLIVGVDLFRSERRRVAQHVLDL